MLSGSADMLSAVGAGTFCPVSSSEAIQRTECPPPGSAQNARAPTRLCQCEISLSPFKTQNSKFKILFKLTMVLAALGAAMWTPSVRVTVPGTAS